MTTEAGQIELMGVRLSRVTEPEAVALIMGALREGRSIYLLGGEPGAGEEAAARLREASPGLVVAGTLSPPLGFERDPDELGRTIEAVRAATPDIVYVGLGFPKQELVAQVLRDHLPGAWFLGVGISISFVAGRVQRAPAWMQRTGLEWTHRIAQEPRRLANRYLRHDIPFAGRLFADAIRKRRLRAAAP